MYLTQPSPITCYKILLGPFFTNITFPEFNLLVLLSDACDASTNAVIVTDLPLGYGIYFGNSSMAYRYCALNSSPEIPDNNVGSILGNIGSKYIISF